MYGQDSMCLYIILNNCNYLFSYCLIALTLAKLFALLKYPCVKFWLNFIDCIINYMFRWLRLKKQLQSQDLLTPKRS